MFVAFLQWPILLILHYANVEVFEAPPSLSILWKLLLNWLFNVSVRNHLLLNAGSIS